MNFQNTLHFVLKNLLILISIISPQTFPEEFIDLIEEIQSGKPEVIGESVESGEVIVARVIDGDTIKLGSGETLRYIGIDTPEITKEKECFAEESKDYNKKLVEGKVVRLEKDVSETDRYGRLLRYVYVDQKMVNLKLVSEGYAFTSSFPPDIKHQELFLKAEEDARKNKKGLWGKCPI